VLRCILFPSLYWKMASIVAVFLQGTCRREEAKDDDYYEDDVPEDDDGAWATAVPSWTPFFAHWH
jgi:hypothetical protein